MKTYFTAYPREHSFTTYHPEYLAMFFKANTNVFQCSASLKMCAEYLPFLQGFIVGTVTLVIKIWICSNYGPASYQQGGTLCKHSFQQWSFLVNTPFSKGQGDTLTRVNLSFIVSVALKASPDQWWLQMSLNVQQQKILQAMNFDCSAHKRLQTIWKEEL